MDGNMSASEPGGGALPSVTSNGLVTDVVITNVYSRIRSYSFLAKYI